MLFANNINLGLNQINNAVVQPLATAPSTTKLALLYYDSVKKSLGTWNGTGWDYYAITAIPANSITYSKIQQVTAARLLGNPGGSLADMSEITLGTGLSFSGATLNTAISSVAGKTGAVTLTSSDVSLGNVVNSLQVINTGGVTSFQAVLSSAIPSAGTPGRIILVTDTKELYRDNGTSLDRLSSNVNSPLTYSAGNIGIQQATSSQSGYLSSTDWTTFNTKEPAITAGNATQYYRGDKTFATLNTSALSDFSSAVTMFRLDQFANPATDVSLANHKLTNLATPTTSTDAATKAYVDSAIQGLVVKTEATLVTTAALPTNTYNNAASGVGATLTGNANGALSIDGVTVTASARVLIKNEATTAYNGIYIVTQVGSASLPYILTRTTDADSASNTHNGDFIFVRGGVTNANTGWTLQISSPITIGVTAQNWIQFSGAGTYLPGSGLTLVGSTFNVAQGTGIVIGSNVAIDTSVVVRKTSTTIGDNTNTTFTVTHNFGTRLVSVSIYDASTLDVTYTDVNITTVNAVTVTFATAPTTNQYVVVVQG